MATWKTAAVNFDQMHMNKNVEWVVDHPDAELVGLCDENPESSTGSLARAAEDHDVPDDRQYADVEACLTETDPDIVLMGPQNADHADYTERVASHDVHVIVEKPFADTLENADRMIATMEDTGNRLAINWPSTWSPTTRELHRRATDGSIGDVVEVEAYIGHAGPPRESWFYDDESGGGSMLDFLGYGAVNTTWYRGGEVPTAVSAERNVADDADVDTRSVSVLSYGDGRFSTYETTWERHREYLGDSPDPKGGYVVVGTEGTLSTRGVDGIRVQSPDHPDGTVVDPQPVEYPHENVIQYLIHCLEEDEPLEGPTAPSTSRKAQRILDTARRSADAGERQSLID
jgi:glucose-fructose oxidoreductase